MDNPVAYGVYLMPPPELAYHLALTHSLLKSNFGITAAAKFMPHCTLLAFLHLKEGKNATDLTSILDQVLPNHTSFPLKFTLKTEGFIRLEVEKVPELMSLQASLKAALWPLLSEYGQTRRQSSNFNPHFTLAFRDLPEEPGMLTQIDAFCHFCFNLLPKELLTANLVQLVEFKTSAPGGWDDPYYWQTLSWQSLTGYSLKQG